MVEAQALADAFARHRPVLLALAYRMLGDTARAEELVQDAWLRSSQEANRIQAPRPYLVKVVTRLCLNELASARVRREESRGDRLPEPVDLESWSLSERIDRISMAFVVALQRLSAAERAVLLLHDVFDYTHAEVADMLGKSEAACRQLLRRAKQHVADGRRTLDVPADRHRELLGQFLAAMRGGDLEALKRMLTDDVVLIADGGAEPEPFGRVANVPHPVRGVTKVAAFLARAVPQGSAGLAVETRTLNGEPAALVRRGGDPYAVVSIALSEAGIDAVFVQADPRRLGGL